LPNTLLSLYILYIVDCTLFHKADKMYMYMRPLDSTRIFNVALCRKSLPTRVLVDDK